MRATTWSQTRSVHTPSRTSFHPDPSSMPTRSLPVDPGRPRYTSRIGIERRHRTVAHETLPTRSILDSSQPESEVRMDPIEAHQRRDEVQLLDVREPDEWRAGHIVGALHLPMSQLADRHAELADDRPIVAVCRSGGRSGQVTAALQRAGYDVHNLEGGMKAWDAADLPY